MHYNPYTQNMDIMRDTNNINSMVKDIRYELDIVEDALSQLSKRRTDKEINTVLSIWVTAIKLNWTQLKGI